MSGGSVTPAFMPGLPLVLAGGTWPAGLGGALLMPAVLGACAVLSFAGLVGRLCGAWWAVAGELVLAVGLPEVYTSRAPFSEPLVQVLLFGGLCLFIDSLVARRRLLAGLGGLALGLTVLASVASLGVLLPAFPVLALLFVAKRELAVPFGAGLVLGIGAGLGAGLVLARAYLSTVSAQLHLIGLCAFYCCAVTALLLTLAIPGLRGWLRRVCAYQVRVIGFKGEVYLMPSLGDLAQWLALVLPVVVLVGLAERPYLQTVRGQADPAMVRAVAALQRLEGLPVDGLRQYYESSLHWVLWYLGAPALLLACVGVATLGHRSVEAVLRVRSRVPADAAWPDADALAPRCPCRQPRCRRRPRPGLRGGDVGTAAGDRRLVGGDRAVGPVRGAVAAHGVPPAGTRGAARARAVRGVDVIVADVTGFGLRCLAGGSHGGRRLLRARARGTAARDDAQPGPAQAGWLSSAAATGVKLTSRVQLRGVGASATYGGSIAAAAALCAAIGPSASVLVTEASTAATYAPVIRGMCGQPVALVVPAPSASAFAAELGQAVRSVEQAWPASGAARPGPLVGVPARSPAAAGGRAPHLGRCRVTDRGPGRHLAGRLRRLAGRPGQRGELAEVFGEDL